MKRLPVAVFLGAATVLLLFFFHGPVLTHPNDYVFGPGGDGIKNYYTYLYYLKQDAGFHFSGMNYPFGEHVVFTDNQPLVALLSKAWQTRFGPVYPIGIGILNSLMIWSMVPTVFLVFLILRRSLLPRWPAAVIALLISFMAPQHFRLIGHYALAYSFVIPLQWYLVLRLQDSPRRPLLWCFLLVLANCLMGLVHPYYLAIGTLLLLSYAFVLLLQHKKAAIFLAAYTAAAGVLPIFLFRVLLSFTDPIIDRPDTPYGFFAYRTSFDSVFLPVTGPLRAFINNTFKTEASGWESWAYVGLAGLLCLLLTLLKFYRQGKRKQWNRIFKPALPSSLQTSLWAGVLILLFSMAIPLKYGLKDTIDYLTPLKQFRSIGRFAWIFYYIFTVYSAFYFYRLYRWGRMKRKPALAVSLAMLLLLLSAFEAYHSYKDPSFHIKNQVAAQFLSPEGNYEANLRSVGHTSSDFQAIVPLPYYSGGSEKFDILRGNSLYESMRASFDTSLPISAVMMSRTSGVQAMQQLQLISSDLLKKDLVQHLPSPKPLLLLVTKDSLGPQEQNLQAKGQLIFSNETVSLYRLPLDSLRRTTQPEAIAFFEQHKSTLTQHKNLFLTQNRRDYYVNNFEAKGETQGLFDPGAFPIQKQKNEVTLFSELIPDVHDSTLYEISAWIEAQHAQQVTIFRYRTLGPDGNITFIEDIDSKIRSEIYGGWVRVSANFHMRPGERLQVDIVGKNTRIDHMLMRPVSLDIYQITPQGALLKNNYLLRHPPGAAKK